MSSELKIYPYNMGSGSSRALANELDARRIRLENSRYTYNRDHIIINWGNGSEPDWYSSQTYGRTLNRPSAVSRAANKLTADSRLQGTPLVTTPPLSRHKAEANHWLEDGHTVLGRDLTRGSGGRGITVYNPDTYEEIPNGVGHRFYTKYIKKRREFRIHVGINVPNLLEGTYQVLFIQEKKRRAAESRDSETYNPYIRNYNNEWIFAHNDLDPIPDSILVMAKEAVHRLELHFGAVDIIYNAHYDQPYVLEVNTACGMEGRTLQVYAEYFRGIAENS